MKYIIHACRQRMWYVVDYLVPSMKKQGITDIVIKCDEKRIGNLESCIQIFESMPNDDNGAWHLQDDVIICRNFKKRTEKKYPNVICGFVCSEDENIEHRNFTKPENMWWSFPCIYIPNKLAREFADWFRNEAIHMNKYSWMIERNKYDDYFFKEFMVAKHPNDKIFQLVPSLVDHVDYLIGGTTDKYNKREYIRAKWFADNDLVENLKEKLEEKHYE